MTQDLKAKPSAHMDEVWGDAPLVTPDKGRALKERGRHMLERAPSAESALLTVGRAIFGGFFLYNGVNHVRNRAALTEYAKAKTVPAANAAVLGSGALLIVGGLSIIVGVRPKLGAAMIAGFLLGVSPKMHAFWEIEDEGQRMQEFVNFTKNLALLGGAALAAAIPEPWPASLSKARA